MGDPRGWSLDPIRAAGLNGGALAGFHLVSLKPGSVRGNHFHTHAREWILVFGGEGRLLLREGESAEPQELGLGGEEPAFFEIPPGVEHAIQNTSRSEMYLLAFYDRSDSETRKATGLL
jgi:oxalate decarboxylase/phosphoglucose isomerase-like protein (cupin superfamily)